MKIFPSLPFCCIWSGSALFANYPFRGFPTQVMVNKIWRKILTDLKSKQLHVVCIIINAIEQINKGKSISNQPIPFPIDRDTQDFHALFQYVLGLRAKLHPYRVIHS